MIDATDSHGRDAKYEAVVWEKEWENFLQLTSFEPANWETAWTDILDFFGLYMYYLMREVDVYFWCIQIL